MLHLLRKHRALNIGSIDPPAWRDWDNGHTLIQNNNTISRCCRQCICERWAGRRMLKKPLAGVLNNGGLACDNGCMRKAEIIRQAVLRVFKEIDAFVKRRHPVESH